MKSNAWLWVAQGLLAAVFLFAGGMKLVLPLDALKGPIPLPGLFLRFIGVAEVTGAIGLILPWLLSIRRALTPLAAAGLVVIMAGATILTVVGGAAVGGHPVHHRTAGGVGRGRPLADRLVVRDFSPAVDTPRQV